MNTENSSPDDSMISLHRRDFVRKSALATGAVTFAGLIKAAHGGPPATTTSGGTTTTAGVLTVVSRTHAYWANYTVTSYVTNPTANDLMQEIWQTLYGGAGSDDPVTYEPGPESNYVSVNWLVSISHDSGPAPTFTQTGPNTYVLSFDNTTLTITKRIKTLPM